MLLDTAKIIGQSDFYAITQLTAHRIDTNRYFSAGDWLNALPDGDLSMLVAQIETIETPDEAPDVVENVGALSIMVALAEGLELTDDEAVLHRWVNGLIMLITLESLARKGVIDFDRSAATLGSDQSADRTIARLKDAPPL